MYRKPATSKKTVPTSKLMISYSCYHQDRETESYFNIIWIIKLVR